MATKVPPKSILKQRTPQKPHEPTDEEKAKAEEDRRNMSIALNHANKLQIQKKIELLIVKNIERLLDLPTPASTIQHSLDASTATQPSSHPPDGSSLSSQDATLLITLIHPFQPSDFASLIEERRINGSCGWTLCPKPPRSEALGSSAAWKLKGKGMGDFCSTGCVRKSLYVKAQLSEVPAWERRGGEQAVVVLPSGDGLGGDGKADGGMRAVSAGGEGVANQGSLALATERGEDIASFRPRQVMRDSVVEKAQSTSSTLPAPPQLAVKANGARGGAIEGYEAKFSARRKDGDGDDESEDDDVGVDVERDRDRAAHAQALGFTSEIKTEEYDDHHDFDEEEEAAWREMQNALQHLGDTGHDR